MLMAKITGSTLKPNFDFPRIKKINNVFNIKIRILAERTSALLLRVSLNLAKKRDVEGDCLRCVLVVKVGATISDRLETGSRIWCLRRFRLE
ncbi:MAG TPA: hypothetical protein VJ955_05570 [Desulfuromonadales bacterium]|nr:hypothetical protein [Desulfuromonadales bacterium]